MSHMIAFIKPISTKTSPGELWYLQIGTLTSVIMTADLRLSNIALKNSFSDGVRLKLLWESSSRKGCSRELWPHARKSLANLGRPSS